MPDDVSLANELFTAQTDDLIFSKRERNSLAEEIAEVLSAVRASEPKLAGVSPLPDYDLRAVYIGLTADSVDTLIRNIGDGELFGPVLTGIAEVDSLNSRLGLKGFWVLGQEDRADIGLLLCLGDRVNIPVAVEKYAMLDAVATADHSGRVGDASDIGMEKVGPEWYMLADLASGDCPAGCTEHEFFHFRVSDGSVHSYTEKEAHEIAIFDRLREDYLR